MDTETIIAFIFVLVVIAGLIMAVRYGNRKHREEIERRDEFLKDQERNRSRMSPEELQRYEVSLRNSSQQAGWGPVNRVMICPHCQMKGRVHAKPVNRKKGISGVKATGALLTGGLSILATGLSRKEGLTQTHCDNCGSTWDF